MERGRKTDRRYATTKIPGDPGLSNDEIAKLAAGTRVKRDNVLISPLPFQRLDAEFFLRDVSRQEDEILDGIEDLDELMMPQWNLG